MNDPARFVMFCPVCNDALYPHREQPGRMTFRSASRRLLMEHLNNRHASMNNREKSLLADKVADNVACRVLEDFA